MKHKLLLPLLLLLVWAGAPRAGAQNLSWQGVINTSPSGGDGVTQPFTNVRSASSVTDAAGNIIFTGNFFGTVTFGSTTLTTSYNSTAYMAKWSPATSSWLWAISGGAQNASFERVAVSGTNLYVAGTFTNSVTLGGSTQSTPGFNGMFVAKYTDSGSGAPTFGWMRINQGVADSGNPPTTYNNDATSITVAGIGVSGSNVYVGGNFRSRGTVTISGMGIQSNSSYDDDYFVAKFVDNGSSGGNGWAIRSGGTLSDAASGMAVSGSNIYLCGTFFSSTTHGSNNFTTSNSNDGNLVLVKYADNGNSASIGWALADGTTRNEGASCMVASGSNIYIGGFYTTTSTLAGSNLSTSGNGLFVAKYTDNGNSGTGKWAIGSTAGTGTPQVRGLAVSGTNIFATGAYFGVGTTPGSLTVAGSALSNSGPAAEIYVARFIDNTTSAANGTALSAGVGGTGAPATDVGSSVNASGGTVYVLGSAKNGAAFGSNTISVPNTTGNSTYIARASVPGSNAAPTDLSLSNSSVAENAGANATVGTFSTTDPNAGDTFTYSLVSGAGATDNGSFNIAGNTLRLTASADYETKNSYSIRVRTTDQGGLTYEETFTVSISDVNETPTVATFSPNTGPVGTSGIIVTGTNFASAGAVTVKFNGTTATTVTVNSNTQLTATVPAGATTGPISVQNADGTGTSSGNFTVTQVADLSVTLSDSPDPVSEGANLTYTLGVSNAGPSAASSVTATLSLPAGAGFTSASGTGWSCTQSGGVVTCTRPTAATGAAPSITVVVQAPGEGGSITATATVSSNTTDPANVNNTATATTTVNGVNDAPVNTVPGAQTTVEDVAKIFSTAGGNPISVNDVDVGSGNLEITLTASNGTVTLSRLTGLTFSTGDGTADATMKFRGTQANVNAALDGLSFQPTTNFSGSASLSVATNDLGNTGSGGAQSDTDNISITVTAVNDAPVLTTSGGSSTWSQGGAAVAIDGGLTVADVDNTTLASATVSISAGFQSGADVLAFTNSSSSTYGNIVGSYSGSTLTLTSAGATATLAQWQSALRTVSFTNTAGAPSTTNRTLSFVANDGTNSSAAATKTVTIQLRTATPVVSTPADNSSTNDTTPTYSGTAAGGSTVTVYVDGSSVGTVAANNGNGSWTLTPAAALSQGPHSVYVTAQAGGLAVSPNSNTNDFIIDTTAPTATISSSAGTSGGSTATSPIPFTITFNEAVTGFLATEVTVTGGALTSGSFSGSGNTYDFTVTPSGAGTVTVNVAASVAQDAAGNNNSAAATPFSLTYAPATVSSVTGLTPSPTATASVSYRVVFSQSMTGVGPGNFSLTAPGLTGASITSVSGSGTTYTVLVNTGSGEGTLRLNVQNSTGLTPAVTNLPYTGGTQYTLTRTFTNPVLTIQGAGGLNGPNSDVTAFVDQVQLLQSGTAVSGVANGSFETYNPLASGNYGYNPTGAVWTFGAYAGIAQNGSAFGPATAPDGIAVGVIQTANGTNGQIQQALTPVNGSNYQLRFLASQRNCCSTNDQQLDVFINSVYLGSIRPTDTNGYTAFTSDNFSVIAPTIASFAPNPAGAGIPVTITGSNLGGASSLTLNGAAATILASTATSVTARVPAGATATGISSLTTASGTISSTAFAFLPAPGNALALDGTDDYVSVPNAPALNLTSSFTIEAWIKPTGTGNAVQNVLSKSSQSQNTGYIFPRTDDTWQNLRIWLHRSSGWSQYSVPFGAAYLGKWHHVAATYDGTTVRIYLDGVAVTPTASGAIATGPVTANTNPLALGSQPGYGEYYRGGLDEVRIYSTALNQAQVQADMLSTSPAVPASLVSYYNFDEGTPGGVNTGLTTLYDVAGTNHGTLNGFTSLGTANTTSNWVESYALVVPTAAAATATTPTGFTANWTAPALGTVTNYLLDVSTSSTFATVISGSPFTVAVGTTSRAVSGLTAGTTYYYRVRADKTSVTGQGAPSNVILVTTPCPAPVATTQPVSVALTAAATAAVTAAQVNNGSTANCGAATNLQLRKTGVAYGRVAEGQSLTLTAPAGAVFVSVDFASYGTPTGTDGTYALGSCHAAGSPASVEAALLGNNSATIDANNTTFLDPCSGTPKFLAVRATYAFPAATQLTFSCAETGANSVQLLVTDASSRVSVAPATVTVTQPATPTTTWSGAVSALPTDCGNWSFGKVPDAATNVVVPAGLSRYPTLSGPLAAKDVTIDAGASLTLGSGATLQVNGSWTNNGTATLGGTVSFVGAAAQTIAGSSPSNFAGLSVGKTGGSLTLQRNASVTTALTMSGGVLTTGSYELTTTGATLSETSSSYVLGNVVSAMSLSTAGTRYDFGSLGLALTPSGATLPGSTVVRRVTGTALTGQLGRQSIKRYYDIQPTVNAGLNVAVEFGYFPTELNGIGESDLSIYRSTAGLSGPWQPVPFASQNTTAHTITATGVEHFSVWTLGSRATPLPVTLARFTAERQGSDALLRWTTAQEKDNAYFEVESSADGRTFRPIGRVPGHGTSTTPHDYQLPDRQLSRYAAPVVYYRLRQVDTDGTATLSEVRPVAVPAETQLRAYPNPARTATQLRGADANSPVQLFDAVGRLVAETRADAAGGATLTLPQGLPTGVYLVRAGTQTLRLAVSK